MYYIVFLKYLFLYSIFDIVILINSTINSLLGIPISALSSIFMFSFVNVVVSACKMAICITYMLNVNGAIFDNMFSFNFI